jgi:hypothetical protein
VPTYQPLGQSRDNVRHESCHSTYRQRTMPRPDHKGAKQGVAILDLAETLVKLPRLDSNQQPFGCRRCSVLSNR